MADKRGLLESLAEKRKRDPWPKQNHFMTYADYHGGRYDQHKHVVPWTISADNYDSDIMIMGQDWNSEANLAGPFDKKQQETGQLDHLPTNRHLKLLLNDFLGRGFKDVYATDLFVFVKSGGMSATIASAGYTYSALNYALPQIRIVGPKVVACLGKSAYDALRSACLRVGSNSTWEERLAGFDFEGVRIVGITHTGGQAYYQARQSGRIAKEWHAIRSQLGVQTEVPEHWAIVDPPPPSREAAPARVHEPAQKEATSRSSSGSKEDMIIAIMKANAHQSRDEVVALILKEPALAVGKPVDLRRARAYYSWISKKGLAPGRL